MSESRKGIYFVETETFSFHKVILYTESNYTFSSGILNNALGKQTEIDSRTLTPHESILDTFVATGCVHISINFLKQEEK